MAAQGAGRARPGGPALCGHNSINDLKSCTGQVVVELKPEHVPIPQGYVDPLIWLHVPGEVLRTQDPVETEELILFLEGGLWVISFPLGSSPS